MPMTDGGSFGYSLEHVVAKPAKGCTDFGANDRFKVTDSMLAARGITAAMINQKPPETPREMYDHYFSIQRTYHR